MKEIPNKAFYAVALLLLSTLVLLAFQQRSVQRLEETIEDLEEQGRYFTELCALAESGSLGYANEYFRITKGVVVLETGESEEIKLTANWKDGGHVFVDCSSDAAELSFEEESWESYTTMTVKAIRPGFTVARFTSDATEKDFCVFILVKE